MLTNAVFIRDMLQHPRELDIVVPCISGACNQKHVFAVNHFRPNIIIAKLSIEILAREPESRHAYIDLRHVEAAIRYDAKPRNALAFVVEVSEVVLPLLGYVVSPFCKNFLVDVEASEEQIRRACRLKHAKLLLDLGNVYGIAANIENCRACKRQKVLVRAIYNYVRSEVLCRVLVRR